jgi:hypothetical protein
MAGFFDGHEQLMELLEEVPQLMRTTVADGQRVRSTVSRQLSELEQRRGKVANLTNQLRSALEGLQATAQGGADDVTARMTTLMESAQRAAESLSEDAEKVESEVEGVEAAESALEAALGDAGARATQAAQAVQEGVNGLGESALDAASVVGEASEASSASVSELLVLAVQEAQGRLDAELKSQADQMEQMAEAVSDVTGETVQSLDELSGEQQANLGELGAELAEKAASMAEEVADKLAAEVSSPVNEKLQEAREQIIGLGQQMEMTEALAMQTQATVDEQIQMLEERTKQGRELSRAVTYVISTIQL